MGKLKWAEIRGSGGGYAFQSGDVSELIDEHDLGSCAPKSWEFESLLPHQFTPNPYTGLELVHSVQHQQGRLPLWGFNLGVADWTLGSVQRVPGQGALAPSLNFALILSN